MSFRPSLHLLSFFLLTCLLVQLPIPQVAAKHFLRLNIINFDGYGWKVQDAQLKLAWHTEHSADLQLSAERLYLPSPLNHTVGIKLKCPRATIRTTTVRCQNGILQLNTPLLDPAPIHITFSYDSTSKALKFSLVQTTATGGQLDIHGQFEQASWQLTLNAKALDLAQVSSRLSQLPTATFAQLGGFLSAGTLTLHARVTGRDMQVETAEFNGMLQDLSFSDAEAQRVGEQVSTTFSFTATPSQSDNQWQLHTELAAQQGQVYIEPIFLDFSAQPVALSFDANWQTHTQLLDVSDFRFDQTDVVHTEGQFSIQLNDETPSLTSAHIQMPATPLSGLYQTYLQPFFIGKQLDALDTSGHVGFRLNYDQTGTTQVQVSLDDIHIDDQNGRFAIHGISGTSAWTDENSLALPSQLRWQGGQIYQLSLGASRLDIEAHGKQVQLLQSVSIPVLDGALQIDLFRMDVLDGLKPRWQFAGRIDPISMETFSEAVGWHPLAGTLSGVIPRVTYADQLVEVDGNLQVNIFDGEITVRNLRLEQLLSLAPQLSADIDIDNLDLKRLTETFSFGKIRGKLEGKVHNLVMQDWQPIFFDAALHTPLDDSSAHRISQRAIDNLSSLGGVQGALSRSFLGFFENFSYSRLGFSCGLRLDVCEMDGVEPAEEGYYLVKGGGLPPHINIIGHTRRVAWKELIERLKRATSGASPQIG
jgi:hypothetical protein